MLGYIKKSNLIAALIVAFFTFFIALLVSIGSQALIEAINDVTVAIILLLIIVFLGIFFDIIGTAAAATNVSPFNAKAAKRVFGAKQAVKLARNADKVANFCNDVVGDIAGTLSGAIGASIVYYLVGRFNFLDIVLTGSVMTSFIAAVTVGGKAIGKSVAISNADNIILKVAIILGWWEEITGIELLNNRR